MVRLLGCCSSCGIREHEGRQRKGAEVQWLSSAITPPGLSALLASQLQLRCVWDDCDWFASFLGVFDPLRLQLAARTAVLAVSSTLVRRPTSSRVVGGSAKSRQALFDQLGLRYDAGQVLILKIEVTSRSPLPIDIKAHLVCRSLMMYSGSTRSLERPQHHNVLPPPRMGRTLIQKLPTSSETSSDIMNSKWGLISTLSDHISLSITFMM